MTTSSPPAPPITLVHRAEALRAGWSDDELRRSQQRGELVRIRRGSFVDPQQLVDLNARERHRLVVLAATRRPTPCVVSHISAAALWGIPLYDVDLSRVHFIRPDATSGRIGPARHDHAGVLAVGDATPIDGIVTTSVSRTLTDLARSGSAETAVVAADFALHTGMTTPQDLSRSLTRAVGQPGIGRARRALSQADGTSESPGESLTRLLLLQLAPLDCQVDIRGGRGEFVARTDFGVHDALLLIEFDGRQKYLKHRRPGQGIEEAILEEKQREDALRALGYLVIRVVWRDLHDIPELLARVSEALSTGRSLRARGMVAAGSYLPKPRLGL